MNNQKNQSSSEFENKRNYVLRTMFLSIVGLMLAIFTIQVKAETVETTIQFYAQGNENARGRVTVFDAGNGRQIANGHTVTANNGENKFVFISASQNIFIPQDFVVVVLSDGGYIGSGRGAAGETIYAFASQPVATMPIVRADANGNATLTYTNASGNPVKNAIVTTVEWASYGNARRGRTNAQGQYNFNDPRDLAGSDFLAVEWKGNGAISLTAIVTGDNPIPGGD